MKHRKLRIAWSAACGILCLLLIVLWGRSYWRFDGISIVRLGKPELHIHSSQGQLLYSRGGPAGPGQSNAWTLTTGDVGSQDLARPAPIFRGFAIEEEPCTTRYYAPDWLPILFLTMVGGAAWIDTRFSLRTLLIGMTVLAVLLGAAVWATK